jgi:hypothetical protein
MDGLVRLGNRVLLIGRCFEGSRLEQALLASAYEQAAPLLKRPRPRPPQVALDSSPATTQQRQFAAVGG